MGVSVSVSLSRCPSLHDKDHLYARIHACVEASRSVGKAYD